jgi:hypothetical protein
MSADHADKAAEKLSKFEIKDKIATVKRVYKEGATPGML